MADTWNKEGGEFDGVAFVFNADYTAIRLSRTDGGVFPNGFGEGLAKFAVGSLERSAEILTVAAAELATVDKALSQQLVGKASDLRAAVKRPTDDEA